MPDQTSETPDEQRPPERPSQPSGQQSTGPEGRSHQKRSGQRRYRRFRGKPRTETATPESSGTPQGETQGAVQERQVRPQHSPHQQRRPDVSVVIPLYNEEDSLRELHQQLRAALHRMSVRYELIFVDDGSTDRSFGVLRDLKRGDSRVKIIRFRRNYGKSAALSVGFKNAEGAFVITMDADLQDDPAEIPDLVKRLREGYDLISGWKRIRRDPISKTIPSRFFNFVTALITGIKIHDFNCGLKAYRSEVAKTVNIYGELHRYIPVLAHYEGFRVGEMVVQHRSRKYGKTKFGLGRFWKGFLDLLTVVFTTRYLRRPLHLFGFWGMLAVLAGLVIVGWLSVEWFLGQTALSNRPLFLGGILLIIVGIQFVSIGLLGEMISKTRHTEQEYALRDFIK